MHETVAGAMALTSDHSSDKVQERFAAMFEGMVDGVLLQDPTGAVVAMNSAAAPLGLTSAPWVTSTAQGLGWHHPEHPAMITLRSGVPTQRIPLTYTRRGPGDTRHVLLTCMPLFDATGQVTGVVSFVADHGDRRLRTQRLDRHDDDLRHAIEHAPTGFAVLDRRGRILRANPALTRFLDTGPDGVQGRRLQDWVHPDDRPDLLELVRRMLAGEGDGAEAEVRWVRPDGQALWGLVCGSLTSDGNGADDGDARLVVQIQDTTRYRQTTDLLTHLSLHDPLTGLPNRTLLLDRIHKAIDRIDRSGSSMALLICDVDRFKVINDSLGHEAGDTVLVEVGHRISTSLRTTDTAGRLGGDQFVVVCEGVRDEREAMAIAERLLARFRDPIPVDGRSMIAGLSIGIALTQDTDADPLRLLRDADTAVRRAKDAGRNTWEIADPEVRNRAADRLDLEQSLRQSIARSQLNLHFQPIVDLSTGRRIGHEALLRWRHPERGLLSPGDFLHIAEESGLIIDIGRWVIQHATAVAAAAGPEAGYVSVNVSALQVGRPGLLGTVEAALEDSGLEPERLVLELTESVMFNASACAREELARLDALGTRLVVDDFGTGFSALSYLRDLPISGIKIDRSFTSGLGDSHQCERIVEAVTGLGSGLGVDVVVEGVETEAQRTTLQAIGTPHAQGFLFGRPMPRLAA